MLWIEKIPVRNLFCITCSTLDIMYCTIIHSHVWVLYRIWDRTLKLHVKYFEKELGKLPVEDLWVIIEE
ncbi:MAG: hypothetical protein LV477_06485, partial [Candidatus Nitrosotalea sp.]|nr:hypothetical protein [Candidatus Nitrosotalea sp.]